MMNPMVNPMVNPKANPMVNPMVNLVMTRRLTRMPIAVLVAWEVRMERSCHTSLEDNSDTACCPASCLAHGAGYVVPCGWL